MVERYLPVRYVYALTVLLVALSGCADKSAKQNAQARQSYDAALADVAAADQGYVPVEQVNAKRLSQYRQERYGLTLGKLKEVVQSGSATQRLATRQLLGEIHTSAARVHARAARSAGVDLSARATTAISDMSAVERAHNRVLESSTSNADSVRKFQEDSVAASRDITLLQKDLKTLDARIGELEGQIEELSQQADAASAEGRRIRDEAFPMKGAPRYEALDLAAARSRQSVATNAEADKHAVMLEVYTGERTILARQIDSAQKFLDSLQEQIKLSHEQQKLVGQALAKAEAQRRDAIAKLEENVQAIAKDFGTLVEQPFVQAQQEMDTALSHLADAKQKDSQAPGFETHLLQAERLDKLMAKLNILTTRAVTQGSLGSALEVIATRAAAPGHPLQGGHQAGFQNIVDKLAETQGQLNRQIPGIAAEAQSIAEGLAGRSDKIGELALRQLEILEAYLDRLQTAALRPIEAPAGTDQATSD